MDHMALSLSTYYYQCINTWYIYAGYQTTRPVDNLLFFLNTIDGKNKYTVWHQSKVLGNVKKISLYNQPKPYFFQKIIVKSFLDRSKHSELSIFWLVIYSLCCYEWFLFVHNLNTTNTIRFSYIFQLKINPKN